jgi:hypothetical protein
LRLALVILLQFHPKGEMIMWQYLLTWVVPIAPALTSLFAFLAFVVAVTGAYTALKNQRETTSKNIWRDYLKLTIEHPEFTKGGLKKCKGKKERERYKWFVAHFLWGAEEILSFVGKDKVWRHNLLIQAKHHRDYLTDPTFQSEDLTGYSPALRELVAEAIALPNRS